ncbi:tRNA uridine-5-carboxymethylaminomethyl(34) synthesis GTPase MnmE [Fulvimarina sp. 2208YS6-2-32]|uniref:tRNA modification GTPase MnmE n=1 Tax=Fulvimarina uroteuthidis TaxID=3098149 RepID=A0ABU5I7G2_9HYPH|nr:tRNA uridine-5-carboxymethylaminomethyl(34) synthesis GTPase MnmE [Fulvimarina sp. 2208YS6-2-32]MDY8111057.1 tRNA uridine-5-carboxymethylaminomethyl(34) synthesis GTPase MnmE [Fulvimarina sp. 2208YS6-2-32]
MYSDTIAALSSGALPCGVAVVRVSGTKASVVMTTLAGALPTPRHASLRTFRARDGTPIDKGIALFFDGPATATGEDIAEFHLHGGRAVVAAFLDAVARIDGVRLAQAGEFTRRAFENGRMDLTEAEGLADLLAAETEGQRRAAFAQAGGTLRTLYEGWMTRLTRARAMVEASFDFADEGDVGDRADAGVRDAVAGIREAIGLHLDKAGRGEILRSGFKVAIVGAPNAGKSSLLNALAEREAAIVTDVPGTTRDVISVTLDLAGVPVILSDTAGIRHTRDAVEAIGIARARAAMAEADLILALEDPAQTPGPLSRLKGLLSYVKPSLGAVGHAIEENDRESASAAGAPNAKRDVLTVRTKVDLAGGGDTRGHAHHLEEGGYDFAISATTGAGLSALVEAIASKARSAVGDPENVIPLRVRQRELLQDTARILSEFLATPDMPAEIAAETLRRASNRLGALTGQVGVEDLLDVIFSEFCIGK